MRQGYIFWGEIYYIIGRLHTTFHRYGDRGPLYSLTSQHAAGHQTSPNDATDPHLSDAHGLPQLLMVPKWCQHEPTSRSAHLSQPPWLPPLGASSSASSCFIITSVSVICYWTLSDILHRGVRSLCASAIVFFIILTCSSRKQRQPLLRVVSDLCYQEMFKSMTTKFISRICRISKTKETKFCHQHQRWDVLKIKLTT